MKPSPIKVAPLDAQRMVMSYLRMCNYVPQRTSEIARALNVQPSCIRRAGLYLAAHGRLRAELVPGRGKGEYMFILEQLDLFDDHKDEPKQSLWQRIKSLFK
mgnify:FL=1